MGLPESHAHGKHSFQGRISLLLYGSPIWVSTEMTQSAQFKRNMKTCFRGEAGKPGTQLGAEDSALSAETANIQGVFCLTNHRLKVHESQNFTSQGLNLQVFVAL